MIKNRRVLPFFAAVLIYTSPVFAGPTFSDVPETHEAYSSITKVADLGIILGDTSGKFNPSSYIDKFQTSKILAGIAGYKQIDYTDYEKDFYDRAYEKNKAYLNQLGKTYSKWNTTADREIAFLLEKEILTPDDLKDFIVYKEDGSEGVRAITREEAAVFITKVLGKKSEALANQGKYGYADESNVAQAARPYVNYMLSVDLMSVDLDMKFNPRQAVTRAEMAVLIDRTINIIENNGGSTELVSTIDTINATFEAVVLSGFETAVSLILSDGERNVYKISPDAEIMVDGFLKTADDLTKGMELTIVLTNGIITDIKVNTIGNSMQVQAGSNLAFSEISGVIKSITTDESVNTVGIEITMLSPKGEALKEERSYVLNTGCTITRNGESIDFSGDIVSDIVSAKVSGAKIYSMELESKNRSITGTLAGKEDIGGSVTLSVESQGSLYTFNVTNNSFITKSDSVVSWQQLTTGDSLKLYLEYDNILEVHAVSMRSTISGTVSQIRINPGQAFITMTDIKAEVAGSGEYLLDLKTVNPYSFYPGDEVTLHLNSSVAEFVHKAQDGETGGEENDWRYGLTGQVKEKTSRTLTIDSPKGEIDIEILDSTRFFDSKSGEELSASSIKKGSKVYATKDESDICYITLVY